MADQEEAQRVMMMFTLAIGGSISLDTMDIQRIWSADKKGHSIIECYNEDESIEVVCAYDDIMDHCERIDLRVPERERPKPPKLDLIFCGGDAPGSGAVMIKKPAP
jgi:hypothetical protein